MSKPAQTHEQRPYWNHIGRQPGAGGWPIGDLNEWLAVTVRRKGFVCQVLWRESPCRWLYRNFSTPKAAANFVLQLQNDAKGNLLDVGIDPDQPNNIHRRIR